MKKQITFKELKKAYDKTNMPGYGQDIAFCATANLFIAEKLERIESLLYQLTKQTMRMNALLSRKGKRNPTPYQLKVGRFLKEGKSLQEAHKLARGE